MTCTCISMAPDRNCTRASTARRCTAGVDKRAWRPLFLLPEAATLQLLSALEREYGVRLHAARRFVDATARDAEEQASYMSVQRVNMPTQEMATAVVEGLQALVKRAKSQVWMAAPPPHHHLVAHWMVV